MTCDLDIGNENGSVTDAVNIGYDCENSDEPFKRPASRAFVETNVKLAREVLGSGSVPYLENFYEKCNTAEDRSKAIELLTSVEIGKTLRGNVNSSYIHPRDAAVQAKRPQTAMASYGRTRSQDGYCALLPQKSPFFNPYETSQKVHYPIRPFPTSHARRPGSTLYSFSAPRTSDNPTGNTTYRTQFRGKKDYASKAKPIRTGSASGDRNNNPHPNKEFMVWRYPRSKPEHFVRPAKEPLNFYRPSVEQLQQEIQDSFRPSDIDCNIADDSITEAADMASNHNYESKNTINPVQLIQTSATSAFHQPAIDNEIFDRVIRGKCRSTYQTDFSDSKDPSASIDPAVSGTNGSFYGVDDHILDDPRDKAQYSLDSMTRSVYSAPPGLPKELSVPTTRYATNRGKGHPAYGTLPGVINSAQMHILGRTTYDCDINERANQLYGITKDIRLMGRKYSADALRKTLDKCGPSERENILRIIGELERIHERRERPVLAKTMTVEGYRQPTPSWISRWSGPN